MKIKTSSFAAALAVLLAFCLVFMTPVGADGIDCSNGCSDSANHVAAIGDIHYATLDDAINNAGENSVVVLLKDIKRSNSQNQDLGPSYIIIPTGKKLLLILMEIL